MSERVTRSQTGATPRKTTPAGYVETPGRRGRPRKSVAPDTFEDNAKSNARSSATSPPRQSIKLSEPVEGDEANGYTNGYANGHANGHANGSIKVAARDAQKDKTAPVKNHKYAPDQHIEFGGQLGVSAIMVGFPILMWYMWLGATYFDGHPPYRAPGETFAEFGRRLVRLLSEGAYPNAKAWAIYWVFLVIQGAFYLLLPGIYSMGKPLEHLGGKQLQYYCSAWSSFYLSIAIAAVLHFTGIFPLYTILDEFGPLLSVAIISGWAVAFVAYLSAIFRGQQHRMSGLPIYDFFMGAELNPRLFKWLDFKMFFEVRLPWFMLFFLSAAAAARQYEQYGYVSGEVGFILMAHWLYANACCKAEELIVTTWDMYYEKWGFMLIFWNMAGVPLSYCHCTIYLANHPPSEYAWPKWALVTLFVAYLFVYWVWDTANSQKNMFRMRERGTAPQRKLPPQLPWKEVGPNPKIIKTATGDSILADGWYGKARKVHYACDMFFAFTWGLITGFRSPFPWFYPVFFACMITHRAIRDIQKCRLRYGDAWMQYEKQVPYLFIPYVF